MNAPAPSLDFLPLTAPKRQRIERTIEALLSLLDTADGDPDVEASLGWDGGGNQTRLHGMEDMGDDREDDGDDLEIDHAESGIADADALHLAYPFFYMGGPSDPAG